MITTHTSELLQRLREGGVGPDITAWLEQTPADQLVEELRSLGYGLTFQERHIGKKWEISLARYLGLKTLVHRIPDLVVSFVIVPVYLDCLMLSIEENRVTGISRVNKLTVRSTRKPEPGLALKSGHGFQLDKFPDGWEMKPVRSRAAKLSRVFLQNRGWRFDHLQHNIPYQKSP